MKFIAQIQRLKKERINKILQRFNKQPLEMKIVSKNIIFILLLTSQPGPGAAREKFDELTSPIWTFYINESFLSRYPFGF